MTHNWNEIVEAAPRNEETERQKLYREVEGKILSTNWIPGKRYEYNGIYFAVRGIEEDLAVWITDENGNKKQQLFEMVYGNVYHLEDLETVNKILS